MHVSHILSPHFTFKVLKTFLSGEFTPAMKMITVFLRGYSITGKLNLSCCMFEASCVGISASLLCRVSTLAQDKDLFSRECSKAKKVITLALSASFQPHLRYIDRFSLLSLPISKPFPFLLIFLTCVVIPLISLIASQSCSHFFWRAAQALRLMHLRPLLWLARNMSGFYVIRHPHPSTTLPFHQDKFEELRTKQTLNNVL